MLTVVGLTLFNAMAFNRYEKKVVKIRTNKTDIQIE
jgi:hypothetical protein